MPAVPPMGGGGGSSYGRGGPASYGSGLPSFMPPSGGFNIGRGGGGGGSHRGLSGRLGNGHGDGRDYKGGRFGGDKNSGGRGRGFGGR